MSKFFLQEVEAAVDALLLQQVILYPTDTVWGIGCDAEVPPAVDKIYAIKQRAAENPCIVLVADEQMFAHYAAVVPANLSDLVAKQEKPTTYVVPASPNVAKNLLGPDGTIGLRIVKDDEFSHRIVRRLGHGVVSTSANISGRPTPATFAEVEKELIKGVDYVVNWRQDDTSPAAPSRVVRVQADGSLEVLRD